MLLNIAYVFALADLPAISSAIVVYGKSAGLDAMNSTEAKP
jgi:hypothetical protein